MKTLKTNYARNIDILKENLKRGMTLEQVTGVINSQEKQFINANLYKQDEKTYINEMRKEAINYFSHLTVITN